MIRVTRSGAGHGLFVALALSALGGSACLAENLDGANGGEDKGDEDNGDDGSGDGADDGSPGEWPEDGMLACNEGDCTFLFVAETLDDRIEMFAPRRGEAYLGTLDVDLVPNPGGDTSQNQLDEPYEMVVGSGSLAALVGHYPTREAGSVVEFPLSWLSDHEPGSVIAVSEYFTVGAFEGPVRAVELEEMEAIYAHRDGGRMLVSAFANDLFGAEESWTNPAVLLTLDLANLDRGPGRVVLNDVGGAPCQAGGEIVPIGGDRFAVACDGNDAVAIVAIADGSDDPEEVAESVEPAALCDLTVGVSGGTRTRHLASHGDGTFAVSVSPTGATNDAAQVWIFDEECTPLAPVTIVSGGIGTLNQLVAWPGEAGLYLVAGTLTDRRGIHVVRGEGSAATHCGTLAGFEPHWSASDGGFVEPFGLAVTSDGSGLAVGAGPFSPNSSTVGYGKVLWAELVAGGSCGVEVDTVVDLTDGENGHADAAVEQDPKTWRRGPNVLHLVSVP